MPGRLSKVVFATIVAILTAWAHAFPTPLPTPDLSAHDFRNGAQVVAAADVSVIGIGPGGRAYVAGPFTAVDGLARPHGVARFNLDGSLDATWAPSLPAGPPGKAFESDGGAVALAVDGDLVLVPEGSSTGTVVYSMGPSLSPYVAAFDAAGYLYAAFSGRGPAPLGTSVQASVHRFTPAGVRDAGFALILSGTYDNCTFFSGTTTVVHALRPLGGYLYIGGNFLALSNPRGNWNIGGAVRVSPTSGDVDASWTPMGTTAPPAAAPPEGKLTCFPNPTGTVADIVQGPGQTVYLGGGFERQGRRKLGRFSTEGPGLADSTWQPAVIEGPTGFPVSPGVIVRIALDPAGAFVYATAQGQVGGMTRNGLVAYSTAPGAAVSHWDPNVDPVYHLAATADRLVVGGTFSTVAGVPRLRLAALPRPDATPTGPLITMSPRFIDLGNVPAGTVVTRDLAVGNAGDAPLTLGTIANLPPWTQTNDCAPSVAPGAACSVRLRLEVNRQCCQVDLAVTSNAGGTPQAVRLKWQPTYAQLAQKMPLTFASTPLGLSRTSIFVVRNSGIEDLRLAGVTVIDSARPGEFTHSNDCPAALSFNATCGIAVTYTPQVAGAASATLRLSFGTPTMVGNLNDLVMETTTTLDGTGATAADDSDGDGLSNGLEGSLGKNPLVKDNDVFASSSLFAMQQYRDFLAREGDSAGIAYWTGQLDSGATTRARMAEAFLTSPEFEGTIAPVARLYFAYFLRIPDYEGVDFWISRYRGGEPLGAISNAFATSPEFIGTYGALDNPGFVDRVYRNVLGRPPDGAGLAYWTSRLSGGMTRGEMMLAFSESPEYRSLISSEVLVTMCYMGMLRRGPDPGGFTYWVRYLDQGNSAQALIGAFLGSPEYRNRFLP